jgi:4-hydroxy-4-methyl-2-oxoglutarate aldolase
MATPQELERVRPRLLGLIDESRIARVGVRRPRAEVIAALLELTDLCSSISDVLDSLGVGGAVPAHVLAPLAPGQRVCGPAVTVRYVPEGGSPGAHLARGSRPLLADRDLYGVAEPGDVAVFDCGGEADASVMGGLSARWARRMQVAGCIVNGGVRDIDTIRALGLPVWSRGRTPITGRHRLEAVEINGTVSIGGVQVRPGDVVAADGSGVCVIPAESVDRAMEACRAAEAAESSVTALIDAGAPIGEVTAALRPERW